MYAGSLKCICQAWGCPKLPTALLRKACQESTAIRNGLSEQLSIFSKMRDTWVMLCFRKNIQPIRFLTVKKSTMENAPNTMLRMQILQSWPRCVRQGAGNHEAAGSTSWMPKGKLPVKWYASLPGLREYIPQTAYKRDCLLAMQRSIRRSNGLHSAQSSGRIGV